MNRQDFEKWKKGEVDKFSRLPKHRKNETDQEWDFMTGQIGTERISFEAGSDAAFNLLSKEISEKDEEIEKLKSSLVASEILRIEDYSDNNESQYISATALNYWKQRCEAAEVILKKYYRRIPDCAELITWHELTNNQL